MGLGSIHFGYYGLKRVGLLTLQPMKDPFVRIVLADRYKSQYHTRLPRDKQELILITGVSPHI